MYKINDKMSVCRDIWLEVQIDEKLLPMSKENFGP